MLGVVHLYISMPSVRRKRVLDMTWRDMTWHSGFLDSGDSRNADIFVGALGLMCISQHDFTIAVGMYMITFNNFLKTAIKASMFVSNCFQVSCRWEMDALMLG